MDTLRNYVIKVLTLIKTEYQTAPVSEEEFSLRVKLWERELSKYPQILVEKAVEHCLTNCKFAPKIVDIIQAINKIILKTLPSQEEIWAELESAIAKTADLVTSFYYTMREENGLTQGQIARNQVDEIFNNLSPLAKQFCINVKSLIKLGKDCNDDYEMLKYEKNRFYKNFEDYQRRVVERNIRQLQMPKIGLKSAETTPNSKLLN